MEARKLAPTVGIVGCLLVLVVLALPYLFVGPPSAITTYYNAGAITPLAAGLLALVAVIVFAAGREDRTDPALAAGATLVFGLFMLVLAVAWAVTVPRSVVTQLSTNTLITYHRGALVLVALLPVASAGWHARSLGLL